MQQTLQVILLLPIDIWFAGVILASFYFWAKRTDRSMAPIERRLRALGYGVIWPYFAYKHFAEKQTRANESADFEAQRSRIMGNAPAAESAPTTPPGGAGPIQNPFDNR